MEVRTYTADSQLTGTRGEREMPDKCPLKQSAKLSSNWKTLKQLAKLEDFFVSVA